MITAKAAKIKARFMASAASVGSVRYMVAPKFICPVNSMMVTNVSFRACKNAEVLIVSVTESSFSLSSCNVSVGLIVSVKNCRRLIHL